MLIMIYFSYKRNVFSQKKLCLDHFKNTIYHCDFHLHYCKIIVVYYCEFTATISLYFTVKLQ